MYTYVCVYMCMHNYHMYALCIQKEVGRKEEEDVTTVQVAMHPTVVNASFALTKL